MITLTIEDCKFCISFRTLKRKPSLTEFIEFLESLGSERYLISLEGSRIALLVQTKTCDLIVVQN